MKKGLIIGLSIGGAAVLITIIVLIIVLSGNSDKHKDKSGKEFVSEENKSGDEERQKEEVTAEEDVKTSDIKAKREEWGKGSIKLNGVDVNLTKATLETITKTGYNAKKNYDRYVINAGESFDYIDMSDGKHREISLSFQNYWKDKPCWIKNGLIQGFKIEFGVDEGLEEPDIVLPDGVTGGMTMSELKKKIGDPDDEGESYLVYDDDNKYDVTFGFDSDKLNSLTWNFYTKRSMPSDDSAAIKKALDSSDTPSGKLDKNEPSSNLKDAEIKIGSEVFQVPLSMADLRERGYTADGADYILNPNEINSVGLLTFVDTVMDKGGNYLGVLFANPTGLPRKKNNAQINVLLVTADSESVKLAKGIGVGSKKQNVIDTFGKGQVDDEKIVYRYSAKRGEVVVSFQIKKDKVEDFFVSVAEKN